MSPNEQLEFINIELKLKLTEPCSSFAPIGLELEQYGQIRQHDPRHLQYSLTSDFFQLGLISSNNFFTEATIVLSTVKKPNTLNLGTRADISVTNC